MNCRLITGGGGLVTVWSGIEARYLNAFVSKGSSIYTGASSSSSED